jgi:hypothetical protein
MPTLKHHEAGGHHWARRSPSPTSSYGWRDEACQWLPTYSSGSVTVADDSLSSAAFTVRCELNRAWITVTTTGTDIDADGYIITTSSGTVLRVAPRDTVTFSAGAPGRYGVALSNLAVNCDAAPTNPDSVTIVGDARNEIAVAVTCARITDVTGSLHVLLNTNLEGRVRLPTDGSIRDSSLAAGSAELTFSNLRATTESTLNVAC